MGPSHQTPVNAEFNVSLLETISIDNTSGQNLMGDSTPQTCYATRNLQERHELMQATCYLQSGANLHGNQREARRPEDQ